MVMLKDVVWRRGRGGYAIAYVNVWHVVGTMRVHLMAHHAAHVALVGSDHQTFARAIGVRGRDVVGVGLLVAPYEGDHALAIALVLARMDGGRRLADARASVAHQVL